MKYLKTFEAYTTSTAFDPTNEEFLSKLKMSVKEGWEKLKKMFTDSKFVEWSKKNLASVIEKDPKAAQAAKDLGLDTKSPDLMNEILEKGNSLRNTPEAKKLAEKINEPVEQFAQEVGEPAGETKGEAVAEGLVNEGFFQNLLKGTLKVLGYGGLVASFALLIFAWMKAALGLGMYTMLLGASLSVGAVTAIVCAGIMVFGITAAVSREFKGKDGKTDAEANRL